MRKITQYDNLINTGVWKNLVVEMIMCGICPYPFFWNMTVTEYVATLEANAVYKINDLLVAACFMRLYLAGRFLFYLSDFLNPRTQRVCAINGCESNSWFAMKALMKQRPFPIILGSLAMSIIIFGYLIKIFESPLDEASGCEFKSLVNCMWNTIITMTSVGYGDIYPSSILGRTVAMMICFWGVLIISFMVVSVTNLLNFSPFEERSYSILMRLYYKNMLKKRAIRVLQSAFVHRNSKMDGKSS